MIDLRVSEEAVDQAAKELELTNYEIRPVVDYFTPKLLNAFATAVQSDRFLNAFREKLMFEHEWEMGSELPRSGETSAEEVRDQLRAALQAAFTLIKDPS